jgi:ketosteroid isomerase-like protein
VEQAPELREIVLRLYEAFSRGDADLMERVTSHRDGLVFIGTDPTEWYEEIAPIRQMLQAQAGAGITVVPGDVRAYREGTVGWVADRGCFKLQDGSEVPFRLTAIFHQEDGSWKLIQEHASMGVSNEEAIGQDLTG